MNLTKNYFTRVHITQNVRYTSDILELPFFCILRVSQLVRQYIDCTVFYCGYI